MTQLSKDDFQAMIKALGDEAMEARERQGWRAGLMGALLIVQSARMPEHTKTWLRHRLQELLDQRR